MGSFIGSREAAKPRRERGSAAGSPPSEPGGYGKGSRLWEIAVDIATVQHAHEFYRHPLYIEPDPVISDADTVITGMPAQFLQLWEIMQT